MARSLTLHEYNADDQVTLHEDSTSFETRYTYDAHARLESAEVYGTSSTAERKVGFSYSSALGDLPTIATYHLYHLRPPAFHRCLVRHPAAHMDAR